jgi:hypothetical protein
MFITYFFLKLYKKNKVLKSGLRYYLRLEHNDHCKELEYKGDRRMFIKWIRSLLVELCVHSSNESLWYNKKFSEKENQLRLDIVDDFSMIFVSLSRHNYLTNYEYKVLDSSYVEKFNKNPLKVLDSSYVEKFNKNPFSILKILTCILCHEKPDKDKFRSLVDYNITKYY